MPGSLLLSPLGEVLPLGEEVRSASQRWEVLPGFFFIPLAELLGVESLVPLLMTLVLSTSIAALPPRLVAAGGQADVAAPCPRTVLRLTAKGSCPRPAVRTLRKTLEGSTTRFHIVQRGELALASATFLRLMASSATPPRGPRSPCSGRRRLPAHPSNTASICRQAQAWASSQGGGVRRGRRRRPEERRLAKEHPIAFDGKAMEENAGGAIGVAELPSAPTFATTSMVQRKSKMEGIDVAVIGAASNFARTPIPPRPSRAASAVGVRERAVGSLFARTSTALHRWQAEGGDVGEADFVLAPGFAASPTSPRLTAPSLEPTAT